MKREKHKIGDVVILSGNFWPHFGKIGQVVSIDAKMSRVIKVQDIDGNGFVGSNDDFFTVVEVKELIKERRTWDTVVDWDHPWLTKKPPTELHCCDEFKDSDFKFCPRCGNEL